MAYKDNIFTLGTKEYLDFDASFLASPFSGDLRSKENNDCIKQALKILLFTNFNERPFQPEVAGNLNNLLFEPIDSLSRIEIEDNIRRVINNWEPRVNIISVKIVDDIDNNALSITLTYNIINNKDIQEVDIIVKRSR